MATPQGGGIQFRSGDAKTRGVDLEQARMNLAFLGKFFGSGPNAATNIAGFIVLVLMVICLLSLFLPTNLPAGDVFKAVLPIITLVVGYLFGRQK